MVRSHNKTWLFPNCSNVDRSCQRSTGTLRISITLSAAERRRNREDGSVGRRFSDWLLCSLQEFEFASNRPEGVIESTLFSARQQASVPVFVSACHLV